MSSFIKRWCRKYGPLPDGATHYRSLCCYDDIAILKVCEDGIYFWSHTNQGWRPSAANLFEDDIKPIDESEALVRQIMDDSQSVEV